MHARPPARFMGLVWHGEIETPFDSDEWVRIDLVMDALIRVAVDVVSRACAVSRRVQLGFQFGNQLSKNDASPVTVADFAVQALVLYELKSAFPEHVFIAEESAEPLRNDPVLAKYVLDAVNSGRKAGHALLSVSDICGAIDLGLHVGGDLKDTWVLDPIDGTKGFMRKQQYCIALGFLRNGIPSLGVLGCPNLPERLENTATYEARAEVEGGSIFHAVVADHVAYMQSASVPEPLYNTPVRVCEEKEAMMAVFMESVEAAHSSHGISAQVASLLGVSQPPVRMDSQVKYGSLSRGDATIFLRFPRGGYVENIWDHAAGVVVLSAAGGHVSDGTGAPLDFSKGRKLNNQMGIVATNGVLHDAVVEAVRLAFEESGTRAQ
ncbi:SAL1 phosphatase [Porphyridium purpureum]|uniref:3'(2'),5'-bisphosphate nucleotidase n=1 Tax=Porphyridium purpureum TaxID=35688 RepID=A0A5J4Z461_PORPP|nr:SAL1 phosphatase [Porphyridium purpureum]|eukprot:POR3844..scf295_1